MHAFSSKKFSARVSLPVRLNADTPFSKTAHRVRAFSDLTDFLQTFHLRLTTSGRSDCYNWIEL